MGDGVNIAARIEGIAKPGAICLSEQAYWQVKGRLDLAATDLGPIQLKNIAEPIRVYSLDVGAPIPATPATAPAPGKSGTPRLSIVVLPFANIGGDPDQEHFVDGVTESLTAISSWVKLYRQHATPPLRLDDLANRGFAPSRQFGPCDARWTAVQSTALLPRNWSKRFTACPFGVCVP
jgi:hypothetical protein